MARFRKNDFFKWIPYIVCGINNCEGGSITSNPRH